MPNTALIVAVPIARLEQRVAVANSLFQSISTNEPPYPF